MWAQSRQSSGELVGKKGKIFHEVGDFGWRRLGDSVRILRSAERLVSSFCCRAHTHTHRHTHEQLHTELAHWFIHLMMGTKNEETNAKHMCVWESPRKMFGFMGTSRRQFHSAAPNLFLFIKKKRNFDKEALIGQLFFRTTTRSANFFDNSTRSFQQ